MKKEILMYKRMSLGRISIFNILTKILSFMIRNEIAWYLNIYLREFIYLKQLFSNPFMVISALPLYPPSPLKEKGEVFIIMNVLCSQAPFRRPVN